jgi:hypothetical protein
MNFKIVVQSKLVAQQMIQMPAKLITLDGRCNAQQARILKEIFIQFIYIQTEF